MVSENCRVCRCSFKRKFGSFSQIVGYLFSENLFKPSNSKCFSGVVLAEVLKKTAISIRTWRKFSDRVCNRCANRIRILGSLYTLLEKIYQKTPGKRKQSTKRLWGITVIDYICNIVSSLIFKFWSYSLIFSHRISFLNCIYSVL